MKQFVVALFCCFLFSAEGYTQSNVETSIRQMMQTQLEAWNRGDVVAFMEPYWKNDSLMFIGKSGVTYGWENTLENYKKGYPDTAAMGKLSFTVIKIEPITKEVAHVIGKWHLTRTEGNLSGHFTLICKKIKGRWMIVSDHSS